MTAEELCSHFNKIFGIYAWPRTYEVDSVTYANCCQEIFDQYKAPELNETGKTGFTIWIGRNGGIMFKGVELILKS